MQQNLAPPAGVLSTDAASVLFIDDAGRRWRLPKGDVAFDSPATTVRVSREVSNRTRSLQRPRHLLRTARQQRRRLRHAAPHRHAQPGYRRLLLLARAAGPQRGLQHPHRHHPHRPFPDARAALWLGVFDDLWQLGKPRGDGGPWLNTPPSRPAPPQTRT